MDRGTAWRPARRAAPMRRLADATTHERPGAPTDTGFAGTAPSSGLLPRLAWYGNDRFASSISRADPASPAAVPGSHGAALQRPSGWHPLPLGQGPVATGLDLPTLAGSGTARDSTSRTPAPARSPRGPANPGRQRLRPDPNFAPGWWRDAWTGRALTPRWSPPTWRRRPAAPARGVRCFRPPRAPRTSNPRSQ